MSRAAVEYAAMSEPAPAEYPYRTWRPARTNDVARPLHAPESLAERRRVVRAGFDQAFVETLARRLGIAPDVLLGQVGAGQVVLPETRRSSLPAPRQRRRKVIRGKGGWVASSALDSEAIETNTVMRDRRVPSNRTARALFFPTGRAERTVGDGSPSSDTVSGQPGRVTGATADQLYERHRLAEHAEAVLGDPASVPVWFGTELGALGDTRPLEWLDTAAGRERLAEVLDAIAYGFPG